MYPSPAARPAYAESTTRGGEAFWDDYWTTLSLPREVRKGTSAMVDFITGVFDEYLPPGEGRTAIELGGAPGQYAAYLNRVLGYEPYVLDRSRVGCEKTRENFRLLGIPGTVFQGDLFDTPTSPSRFDVVYSLGLIEHFDDLTEGIRAHVRLAKPNGIVVVGAPNFAGIYRPLFKRLAPRALTTVNPMTMDISTWSEFEDQLGLEPLFRDYIGGFEPRQLSVIESTRLRDRALLGALHRLRHVTESRAGRRLRRWNAPAWSAYLLGVYRVPSTSGAACGGRAAAPPARGSRQALSGRATTGARWAGRSPGA
jgi:SAM-dependent methyltransferase